MPRPKGPAQVEVNVETKVPAFVPQPSEYQVIASRAKLEGYLEDVLNDRVVVNRWIYAAAKRFQEDLRRADICFDWEELARIDLFFASRVQLVGEDLGKPFVLQPWQLFCTGNILCWKWVDTGYRRFKLAVLQVARGAGKTTWAAGVCLYVMLTTNGARVHCIANNEDQAEIITGTAGTMLSRMPNGSHDLKAMADGIRSCKDRDCEFTPLPSKESSLDGLNPSLYVADEAAEFKSRFLTKLTTTGAKRKVSTGIIITTPGDNPETIYGELVKTCESILTGETVDDTVCPLLYGIDTKDRIEDESCWPKANPGMVIGQPDLMSLRRQYNTMKQSPLGRAEFCRYHCARMSENTGNWLDMDHWDRLRVPTIPEEQLLGKPCWGALDLSKTGDMTSLTLAFPMQDKVYLKGHYFFPGGDLPQKELNYRLPFRTWQAEGRLKVHPGGAIDYESIRSEVQEVARKYQLVKVVYDAWGSAMLAKLLQEDGIPLESYRQAISHLGPATQLWQQFWLSHRLMIPDDPILRRACAVAAVKTDVSGNMRPVKSSHWCLIDPLVTGLMALHAYGGGTASAYEQEAAEINRNFKIR